MVSFGHADPQRIANSEWRVANSAILLLAVEEMLILSAEERKKLLSSLKEAQARINAGDALDFDPATFKKRLIKIYRQGQLSQVKDKPQTQPSS
jgi:hypothetical protein